MAMIAILVTTTFVSAQNADFNNDNVIDTYDLLLLTSTLNQSCDSNCPSDLNNDGVTDVSDMMILIGQWGPVGNGNQASNSSSDSAQSTPRNHDLSWQNEAPVLLDAIYYDQYTELFSHGGYDRWHTAQVHNQGEHAKAWAQENNVEVLPMVYGAVDWDHDDELTEEDKANFLIWLEATVPADYSGPLCLDLEGPWWPLLDSSNQAVVDTAIDFFIENIEYAKAQRPNAKIGFWGFPKKSHTNANSNTASVQRLVNACTALFPDVYENNPGGNDSSRLQQHGSNPLQQPVQKLYLRQLWAVAPNLTHGSLRHGYQRGRETRHHHLRILYKIQHQNPLLYCQYQQQYHFLQLLLDKEWPFLFLL